MTALEAFNLQQKKEAVIVDVREESELRASGYAQGAAWIPLSKIANNHSDWIAFKQGLSKHTIVVFYCLSGGRSGRVAELLESDGYRVANMGAFASWKAAALPVDLLK